MAKDKKKDAKNSKNPNSLLDDAAKSLKKFRKVTRNITKLSTAQKIVGGIALLAAGLTYLAKKQTQGDAITSAPDPDASPTDASEEPHLRYDGTAGVANEISPLRKSRKIKKSR